MPSPSQSLPRTRQHPASGLRRGPRDLLAALVLHEAPVPAAWIDRLAQAGEDIDLLLRRNLIRETGEGFVPGKSCDPAGVLSSTPWSERRRLHLLLAECCHQPPARLEHAARHLEAAGRNPAAAEAYLAAAEQSCRLHQHAAARRAFFSAFRLLPAETPDARVVAALQQFAHCAALAAGAADAAADLRHWAHSPPWNERPVVRAEANLVLAALLAREGRHVESARTSRSAARDLAALGRDADAASASLAAAGVLAYAGQIRLAHEAAEAAVHAAARVREPGLEARASTWRGLILGMQGRTGEGVAELERALGIALRHDLTGAAAEAYRLLGSVREYASLYSDEQAAFARALHYCRQHGETHTAGICLGCLSYSLFRSGDWRRSEETARTVLADRSIPEASRQVAGSVLGLLHAHRGETRPALRLLTHSLEQCRRIGLLLLDLFNLPGLALVAEASGATDEAMRRWIEFVEFWRTTDDRHDGIPGLSGAVCFFAAQGREHDAASAAEALALIAAHTANPEATGAAQAAAGELLLLRGAPEPAAVELRRALAAYEQRVLSVEPIRTRLRLAVALQRTGAQEEARDVLVQAREKARRLGARPLAARAAALLAGIDATRKDRPADAAPATTAWDLLSTRQREVARHLARGLTNKEIAGALSLSVRTIDMHVAHVLARLDCRTRSEAAGKIGTAPD